MNFFDRFSIAFLLIFQLEFSQIRANEIKKNSSAFDDFLTLYGRRNSLEINDINDITRNLLNKFSCLNFVNTDCYNCLSSAKFQMNGLIGTTVERNEFKNVSIVILAYLLDLQNLCTIDRIPNSIEISDFLLKQTNNLDISSFNDYLRQKTKVNYVPDTHLSNYSRGLSSVECIDAKMLVKKYKSSESDTWNSEGLSNIASDIVSSLFNNAPIGCDYPYSSWFIDQLYDSYVIDNQFSLNGLIKLMNDIGIPSSQSVPATSRLKRSVGYRKSLNHQRSFKSDSKYDKCYTASDLIEIHQMSNNSLSKNELIILTPSLLYMHAKGVCEAKAIANVQKAAAVTNSQKYGYGSIAVLIISLLGLLGIFLLPCFKKAIYNQIIIALTALAIGTLFSDAALHILPVLFGLESEDLSDEGPVSSTIEIKPYVFRICVTIFALYIFWVLEMIFFKLTGSHGHSHGEINDSAQLTKSQILHGTSRQVAHNSKKLIEAFDPPDVVNMNFNYFLDQISPSASHGNLANGVVASSTNSNFVFPSVPLAFNPEVHAIEKNEDEDTSLKSKLCCDFRKVQVTAWILLASDAIHNFADGLAVGASFSESINLGISTSIAIICHEIPHELGNYAVLVQCGLTHVQALILNFLTACVSFIGFYVGVSAASDPEVSLWIFSITAGMFFYISLVDLLPALFQNKDWSWKLFGVINIFMWIGFAIMFLLVIFEDKIRV